MFSFFFFLSLALQFTLIGTLLIVVSGAWLISALGFSINVLSKFESAIFFFLAVFLISFFPSLVYF
jgi:hypothetical protein